MSDNRMQFIREVAIVEARETIFFSRVADQLRQWIMVTVENSSGRSLAGALAIEAGGEVVTTPLEIEPGVREYRCHAPVLWPARPPVAEASVRLEVGVASLTAVVTSVASVGHYRPWTVYLLSDVCTDYTWVYDNIEQVHIDDAAVTAAEIALAEETGGGPEGGGVADANHYNFVHAREAAFYLERYPDQAERLFEHIRRGNLTLNPILNMCLTGDMSLEELIRNLYPARAWAAQQGLDIGYANHQETPTIAWAMVPILAGSGVHHLVKSILPYECPWAGRLEEPPLFAWEGPDGSRILVRRHNTDYVEGNFVLRDLRATNTALHSEVIPRYERLGARYPFDAIALVGCYGDLSPRSRDLPAKKAATIAAYNAQGWDYPRLVNAAHKQFWDDIDSQIARRGIARINCIRVPVYRGDYGASWEAWPASLAYDFAGWRRAQERAGTADKLCAILSCLDSRSRLQRDTATGFDNPAGATGNRRAQLAEGWMNLLYLADHAWNGANDANRALNASLRRRWQEAANCAFDALIADGLAALSALIQEGEKGIDAEGAFSSCPDLTGRSQTCQVERWGGTRRGRGERIVVFNGLGWPRSGVVRAEGVEAGAQIIDMATGEAVPTQVVDEGGRPVLYFQPPEVPAVGYRALAIRPIAVGHACSVTQPGVPDNVDNVDNVGHACSVTQPGAPDNIDNVGHACSVTQPGERRTVVRREHGVEGQRAAEVKAEGYRLEGPFYAVEVSPVSGGIVSLYDKVREGELVDRQSPYHLNQCLRAEFTDRLDGVEHTPRAANVEAGPCGPLFGQLVVRAALKNACVTTTITLYTGLDRVDIRNEVEMTPGGTTSGAAEKQELDFAFPFAVPGRQYRFEAPGVFIDPDRDRRPGAGQAVTAVRHVVDVFNDACGVTLSQADSGLVMFGHRTTFEDPAGPDPSNSTVLSLALENCIDWHEAVRDQAGVTHFVFRYSLRGHAGGFDPVAAVRFGWEDNNELLVGKGEEGGEGGEGEKGKRGKGEGAVKGSLPPDVHSFLQVVPENVVLAGFKVAEEEGLIVRLWECAGRDTIATVRASGLGSICQARRTDLLERDGDALAVTREGMSTAAMDVPVPARGLVTVRLL